MTDVQCIPNFFGGRALADALWLAPTQKVKEAPEHRAENQGESDGPHQHFSVPSSVALAHAGQEVIATIFLLFLGREQRHGRALRLKSIVVNGQCG